MNVDAPPPNTLSSDTPSSNTAADRHVHPATVPLRFLKDAPSRLLGIPAAAAIFSRGRWDLVLAVVAAVFILAVIGNWLAYRRFRYGIGARDIVIEHGVFTRVRRSIPFDRIQDVDIERGPLHRVFGLALVRIETGGSASDEGVIDSVTLVEADGLRAAVRAGRAPAAHVANHHASTPVQAEPGGRTIFAMNTRRVLIAGLFNFSLVYLAGLFGLLQTFRGILPFDIDDPGRWIGLVDERLTDRVSDRVPGGAILAVLLVAGAVGVVFGIVRTFAADHGFRLTAQGKRLRRTRGLFTRSDIVIPKRRVQLALLETGPLRSRAGWSELHFQTLSGSAGAGGRQAVAPLADMGEIAVILAEQGRLRLPQEPNLDPVSSRHIVRTLLRKVLLPTILILIAASFWRPAVFALAALPLLIAVAYAERRRHAFALTPDLLFVRRGVWRRQLWIVPVEKVQTVTLTRSPLQRSLGLASLHIDTAGARGMGGPAIVDLRHARACEIVDALSAALRVYSGKKSGTDK